MIFAYIKTLDYVKTLIRLCPQGLTPCSCIICLGKESMLCVCGCSSIYCLLRGWCQYSYTSVRTLCFCNKKNIQNFVDLDACKQLLVLNSYKSAIKNSEKKKS